MKYIATACLVAFTVFACLTLRDVDKFVRTLPATSGKLNATLDHLDAAVGVFHDAEQKQADFYDPKKPGGATQQIQRTIFDLKKLIGRTDLSLNGGLDGLGTLRRVDLALESTTRLTNGAAANLDDTTAKLQPILADFGIGAAAFAKQTPPILESLSETSANGVVMSANLAGATNDMQVTTHNLREMGQKVHDDFMKPVNRAKAYLNFVLDHAYQVRALLP